MFSIRPLPRFTAWIDGLKDEMVRGVVLARIKRLERGLMGDVSPVGDGVLELRVHLGAGWRIYFTRTQKADIKRAKVLAGFA
jgi:putative addiction module killer protein